MNNVQLRKNTRKRIGKDEIYFTGRSTDVCIVKIRKYLSDDPTIQINNLPGKGYSLMVSG